MKKLILLAVVALAVSTAYADDTIYDIQNGTIPSGTYVNVEGVVVTAGPYEFTSSGAYCFVEEPNAGAYSGVQVYWGSANAATYGGLMRGDLVNIMGTAAEYYDLTEIDMSAAGDTLIVVGTAPVPGPDLVGFDVLMDEPWEGVFVTTNCCVCTNPDLGYGEWEVQDAFGFAKCDDKGLNLTYVPAYGDWRILSGIVWYAYGAFNLSPRDDGDVFDPGGPTGTEPATWGGIKALYR
jgi:hypothetical protein